VPRRLITAVAAAAALSLLPTAAQAAVPSPGAPSTTGSVADQATSETSGVLHLTVADDFVSRSQTTATVQTDAGTIPVAASLVEGLTSGQTVTVSQSASGKVLDVDATPVEASSDDAAGASAGIAAAGTHNVWYVRVNWSGATAPTTSVDSLLTSLTSYYSTISASSAGARVKVVSKGSLGTKTISTPSTSTSDCGATAIYNSVMAQLGQSVVPKSRYNHLVLVLPELPAACAWAGLGTINAGTDGRSHIWLNGPDALTPRVLDHEFGHNLGLMHSDALTDSCDIASAKQSLARTCYDDYYDPWDVMGGSFYTPDENTVGFMSAPNLDRIGLLSSAEKSTVASTSASATLAPVSSGAGRRLLTIPYGTRTYSVEYRYAVPGTLDAWLSSSSIAALKAGGVVVRLRDAGVDEDLFVGYLQANQDFTLSGLKIHVGTLSPTAAPVTVTRTGDKTAPIIGTYGYWNAEKSWPRAGVVLTSSTLSVGYLSVGDADSAVSSVTLYVDGRARASVGQSLSATKLAVGGLSQGAHRWHLTVRDLFGNSRSTSDAAFRVDTAKPTITSSPRASLIKGTVSTKTVPAAVLWKASDACGIYGSWVGGSNGLDKQWTGKPNTVNTRITFSRTTQFGAQVYDCRGQLSSLAKGPKTKATLDKQSKRKGYHGTWTATKAKKSLGGTEQVTKKKKAYVTYKVKARSIGWVATKGKDRGKAAVYVDGHKVAVVNLYAKKTTYAQQVFTKTFSKAGTHTIKIVNLSSKKVGVDAFTRLS